MVSSAPTKSVNTLSTWSRPAKTEMMSELGFVYFLARTAVRNVLSVWQPVSQSVSQSASPPVCAPLSRAPPENGPCTHIQGVRVRGRTLRGPQHGDGPREELPRLVVRLQQRPGRYAIQYPPQRRPVRFQQEELLPEALGELCLVIFALGRRVSVFTARLCRGPQNAAIVRVGEKELQPARRTRSANEFRQQNYAVKYGRPPSPSKGSSGS